MALLLTGLHGPGAASAGTGETGTLTAAETAEPSAAVPGQSEPLPTGERQPETIDTAEALEARGAYTDAAAIWTRILSDRQRQLGPEHLATATAQHRLASLYTSLGRFDEAETLFQQALASRQEQLGDDHADLAATLNNLSLLRAAQGRDAEAEILLTRALDIAARALGPAHPDLATGLNNLAQLRARQGRLNEAESALARALAIRQNVLGASHPDTAASISTLADLHQSQGRNNEAEQGYRQALRIYAETRGEQHPDTARSLNNLASFLTTIRDRHAEAEPLFRRALAIHTQQLGPEHPLTATSLANLALLEQQLGRFPQAHALFTQALAIRRKALGNTNPDTATSLHQLGVLHRRLGDLSIGKSMLREALAIYEQALGPSHPLLSGSLNELATLHRTQGEFDEAEDLYQRSLAIRERHFGARHPETALSLNELASLYAIQGLYGKAESLLRRSLLIHETILGPGHANTAASLNNLALLASDQGRYAEAESLYARSLAILENTLGDEHPDLATTWNNLAQLQVKQGRSAEAEPLLLRALRTRQNSLGAEHPQTAASLDHLAALYSHQGRHHAAEPLYLRALRIRETSLSPAHPDTAASLNNLALLREIQGRMDEAESLHQRALKLSEQAFGAAHPHVATSLSNLALLRSAQGRLESAASLARRALAIREQELGELHPDTATSLNTLVGIQLLQGETSAALPLLSRLVRHQSDWLRRELPLQPRELRSSLLARQEDAVASAFALLDLDPAGLPLAMETRLNRQGLLAEIEQRQTLLMGSSEQARDLAERIAGLDRQLALASRSRNDTEQLRLQRQRLERELHSLLPDLRIASVSVSQVASALRQLAPRGVLVEFQRYRPLWRRPILQRGIQANRWGSPRYVALLLHADGRSVSVPLGEAGAIDQAVGRALAASAANRAEAGDLWRQLSDQVLTPLQPHLQGVRELFVSPDGGLHRVPFAALTAPGEGKRLLHEAYQLRLVTTGRDLLRLLQPGREGGPAVLIANPTYNARRGAAGTRSGLGLPTDQPAPPQRRSGELGATIWPPLPGTAQEADALAPLLQVRRPITAEAATATLVLQQKAPRILHIATHGFFRPDPAAQPALVALRAGSTDGPSPIRREDPLLRSGLVMAGANHPDADPNDDGYLTAAEVTGIDLDGTELVTLSACQTGLGDLQTGEGVYGLQRALSVAGARSTLLSLWSVDDAATRAFMESFYRRLLRGEGRAEALAGTQADFRVHANPTYRSPFVWAAFQLSGDWRPIRPDKPAPPER